jgi:hypothetical protein
VPITLLSTSARPESKVGVIRPGDECFDEYRACVDKVIERGFASFPA